MENNYLKRFKENELRSCQLKQLEILKIFDRICRKHNLRYWIDGGTLLGAVRHKGFIPWDDDLDVAMPSEDYKKLDQIIQSELPDHLFWQTPKTDPTMPYGCTKIRDLNSFYVEFRDDFTLPYHKGVFIDIFEMIDYPSLPNKWTRFLLKRISRSFAILRNKRYLNFHSILEIPYFCCIYCALKPIWNILNLVSKKENLSYLPLVNSGGWVYPVKSIFPLTTIKFENIEFPAPCNPDSVLKILYGDYMTLPPVEERQIHATFIKTNLF